MTRRSLMLLAGTLAAVAMTVGTAYSQEGQVPEQGPGGPPGAVIPQPGANPQAQPGGPAVVAPGGPGLQVQGRLQRAFPMAAQFGMQAPPAIAVADGFVFVVYAGTLFQFTVDGLQPVNSVALEPKPPAFAGWARGIRQQRGQGQARPGLPGPGQVTGPGAPPGQ